MRVSFSSTAAAKTAGDVLIVPAFEGRTPLGGYSYGKGIAACLAKGQFSGKNKECVFVGAASGVNAGSVVLVGLGKKGDFCLSRLRDGIAKAVKNDAVVDLKLKKAVVDLNDVLASVTGKGKKVSANDVGQVVAEGAFLGDYVYERHFNTNAKMKKSRPGDVVIVSDKRHATELKKGAKVGEGIAYGVNFARDLVNEPGGTLRPGDLARAAQTEARKVTSLKCSVLNKAKIKQLKMGSFLSVNAGSSDGDGAARLICLEYMGGKKKQKPLVFVGKGLTFDTGGYDLKPAAGMLGMKMDMGGGASALGAVVSIARAKLPVNVVAVVPSTENLVNENATFPGDVVKSMSGITIEINNTDAEGRLILADALTYAQKTYKPDTIVDMATLTGACLIALGDQVFAVMTNTQSIAQEILDAAEGAGELAWQLPLPDEYDSYLDSEIADVSNISGGRFAGTITAGLFLQRFVEKGQKWAHLDIAGVTMNMQGKLKGVNPDKGASGIPVRTLVTMARNRA